MNTEAGRVGEGRPLAVDLFSGLGGWALGLTAAGWDVIRFDLEDMCRLLGEPYPEHSSLVIQDVLTLHGSQFRDVGLIVSSSPCQEFSYRAMPWKRAKALGPPELGIALFDAQFRIQREACEAAGRHIPMVVENVRGAQPWVGRSRGCYGPYALWGDVPALLPMGPKGSIKFQTNNGPRRFQDRDWSNKRTARSHSSGSQARKAASAMIAEIPLPLAQYIARVYKPKTLREQMGLPPMCDKSEATNA